jgi:hypothetical protein
MRGEWDTWRKLMVAGAVLLLINSIFNARQSVSDTDIAYVLANGVGYGLLASGFALAMRKRSAHKKERDEKALAEAKEGSAQTQEAPPEESASPDERT